ncbi:uncharacterized protein KQ657_002520 [Scheffersomyces spartinae]|uniref:Uncharacterized protein n=1 Tax=Scheffersomyces spartinae TaxID=45513 RepID=A0A9P7V762_9ASCO|nr:uncharacterized protein KQ657_002520 [Scheffersomyces spartinae]KAG7192155.1 hypothetical protein KQ657_002520 [Scheffersomyces spartinae]
MRETMALLAALVGGVSGFYEGTKLSSLRYLTENGHRLPTTVGGWYFYHKKKNYVMLLSGMKTGLKHSFRYSVSVTSFFGLEWILDTYVRSGTIDMANTTIASMISAFGYAKLNHLSAIQTRKYMGRGFLLGLSLGFTQDMLIFTRGGYVWYLDKLGIKNPQAEASLL